MKDKIFMTFLCVAVFGVTNAKGDVSNDVGTCMVQEGVEMSDGAAEYNMNGGGSVWLDDEFLFISDNKALQCGEGSCGHGVEIKMSSGGYFFKCIVEEGSAKWQPWEIPFCEDSNVKQLNVEHATYSIVHKGQDDEKIERDGYVIATKGFCWESDCVEGYDVAVDNEGSQSTYRCEAQTGGEANKPTDNGGDGAEIEQLGKWLDDETEKFERSKWRDAEGKFNTARLASDSIAAVVLGTAGGLISSKVIKKKQVENGFEDIKCTIGSQEVADWGDEFQVGIQ